MPDTAAGPLAGIRVLDITSVIMGPLATQIFGDLGADVITVEDPRGTLARVMTPGPVPGLSGLALTLLRNKRNVVHDLKDPAGRTVGDLEQSNPVPLAATKGSWAGFGDIVATAASEGVLELLDKALSRGRP